VAAIVGSVGVAVQCVLFTDYQLPGGASDKHVFTELQASFRQAVDRYMFGILPTTKNDNATRQIKDKAAKP
jgi:hypothetical protein